MFTIIPEGLSYTGILVILIMSSVFVFIYIAYRRLRRKLNKVIYDAEIEKMALVSHFEYLAKYANDIIILLNEDRHIINANDRAYLVYGYSREEMLNMDVLQLVAQNDKEIFLTKFEELIKKGSYLREAYHVKKDGGVFPVEVSAKMFVVEDKKYFQAIVRDITERHHANEELRKLFYAVEQSPVSVVITDIKGNINYVNKKFTEVTGYRSEEVVGQSPRILKSGYTADSEYKNLWNIISSGAIWNGEFQNKKKNGELYWELASISPIISIDNKITHFVAIKEDITERKIAEQRLLESEQRYKSFFFDNKSVIFLVNPENGNIINANHAALAFYGYSLEEMVQLKIQDINTLPGDLIEKEMDQSMSNQKNYFQFKHRLANGETRDVEIYSGRVSQGGQDQLYFIVHDITWQKKMELELSDNQHRLMRAEQVARFGNWEFNLIEQNILFSEGTKSIFGLAESVDLFSIDTMLLFILPEYHQPIKDALKGLIEDKMLYDMEYKIIRQTDGNIIDIHSKAEFDSARKVVFGIIQDVTMLKNAEKELIYAKQKAEESDKLKSAFLANMSHEIRTPMNGILGFVEMLSRENITTEKRNHYANIISQSTQQLLAIVNDILDLSKIETGQIMISKEIVNVKHLLSEVYSFFKPKADEKGIAMNIISTTGQSIILNTDRTRLFQILNNLISNALKFTKVGHIHFGAELVDNKIQFFVEDTGIGISLESQHRLFGRFQQANENISRYFGGTGLGLAISKSLIELLGGNIWFTSEPQKGSVFYFAIPYSGMIQQKEEIIAVESHELNNFNGEITLLVAEDEEINFKYIEEIFENDPIKILHASNGIEAIELCKKHSGIDLLLLDIKMPLMNGYEALKIIKNLKPNLPIIALTAYAMVEDRERALKEGFVDYLSKPVKKEMLYTIINKYVKTFN